MPTITVNPAVPQVGTAATATVTFAPDHVIWPVNVLIKDLTLTPPSILRQRSFSSAPIIVTFTPINIGPHSVCVAWGDYLAEHEFPAEAAMGA